MNPEAWWFHRVAEDVLSSDDEIPCLWCKEDDCHGGCLL